MLPGVAENDTQEVPRTLASIGSERHQEGTHQELTMSPEEVYESLIAAEGQVALVGGANFPDML